MREGGRELEGGRGGLKARLTGKREEQPLPVPLSVGW